MLANATKPSGGTIRERRLAIGISQEALARAADCSTAYVRVLERGYAPDPAASPVFQRVAQFLGLTQNDDDPASTPGRREESARTRRHDEA
jgi:transcriptional regulator with XRE-family HTH domain